MGPSPRRLAAAAPGPPGRGAPRPRPTLKLATTLLRTPGLERFANVPRSFLEQLATEVVWDDRGARALLDARGITCPHFEDYVGVLVEFVRAEQQRRRDAGGELVFEVEDLPLG